MKDAEMDSNWYEQVVLELGSLTKDCYKTKTPLTGIKLLRDDCIWDPGFSEDIVHL